jgi:leader peptidase (prepilin peptidase)/N-methyltransferase
MEMAYPVTVFGTVVAAVMGLIWGSFLNVVIHRLPLDQSIVTPRSHCPHCGTLIPWYRNLPVLSYLLQLGRCAACGAGISVRYLLVELLSAVLTVGLYLRLGPGVALIIYWPYVLAMVALAFIDYEHQILPDEITLGGIVVGLAASFFNPVIGSPRDAFIGAAVGPAFLWSLSRLYKLLRGVEGMGLGDVKMMGVIGAFGGWQVLFPTLLLASLGGLAVALVMAVLGKGSLQTRIPFGTFLAPASVAVILFGHELLGWYGTNVLGLGVQP